MGEVIDVVDLYHSRHHLHAVAKVAIHRAAEREPWLGMALDDLRRGRICKLLVRLRGLTTTTSAQEREAVEREIGYFESNAGRMTYGKFRAVGLFVGSGVVAAGCRKLIGQRLKVSGVRWTIGVAGAIASLGAFKESGRWDQLLGYRALLRRVHRDPSASPVGTLCGSR